MDKNLEIFCVTNKHFDFYNDIKYKFAAVGKNNFPPNYIRCNTKDNIFYKEEYYSELTFQYWFWKNELKNYSNNTWVGFCQKRRFCLKKKKNPELNKIGEILTGKENVKERLLYNIPNEWKNYESVLFEPIFLNNLKLMKILKRGLKSIMKDPTIIFNKNKQTIKLHFDMFHGYGNLDLAINAMNPKDKDDFREFVSKSTSYNPHVVFISRPKIINKYFIDLFQWLDSCEKIFGFKFLKGYDTKRLYGFLAERYTSFWFKKYTRAIEWPWVFIDLK